MAYRNSDNLPVAVKSIPKVHWCTGAIFKSIEPPLTYFTSYRKMYLATLKSCTVKWQYYKVLLEYLQHSPFLQEVELTDRPLGLSHPNITTFYDWFESRYEYFPCDQCGTHLCLLSLLLANFAGFRTSEKSFILSLNCKCAVN
jgi:hypothetical protein